MLIHVHSFQHMTLCCECIFTASFRFCFCFLDLTKICLESNGCRTPPLETSAYRPRLIHCGTNPKYCLVLGCGCKSTWRVSMGSKSRFQEASVARVIMTWVIMTCVRKWDTYIFMTWKLVWKFGSRNCFKSDLLWLWCGLLSSHDIHDYD